MGDPKGFLKFGKKPASCRPVCERIQDCREVVIPRTDQESRQQGGRCMDCGTPFCHWACPIGNYIPEWNDFLFGGGWESAFHLLAATNNLPEITGRLCPALCEYSCVLGLNDDAVTIRENELAVVEKAFAAGLIKPSPPKRRTGKWVAVVGSGPGGLSCAAQLNSAGHQVVVFERADRIGGILRYGIPDFKLEKEIIDRRLRLWEEEGIVFKTGINVGPVVAVKDLESEFDAICLAGGCRVPRDLTIEGRELNGIHFAMDYLTQANKRAAGEIIPADDLIDANGKRVVIIGGGDTGADCVGTAHRQGASCVIQIEVLPKPPAKRPDCSPWPSYPMILKTSSSHEEGGERLWSILTKKFVGENGRVRKLSCVQVEFSQDENTGRPAMKEVPASGFEIEADLVIIAVGFVHPEKKGMLENFSLELDPRGNIKTGRDFMTSRSGVFAAGDMRRGQSLIVWAISEGRRAAHFIDKFLMGLSRLPAF